MKTLFTLAACGLAMSIGIRANPVSSPAYESGRYRNLFAEHLGRTEAELDAKLAAVWRQFTVGDPATERLFYTTADQMTYLPDIAHDDVRTEGQSYGMMLAVQLDERAEFDRIWRWTKRHMFMEEGSSAGYYAWHCRYDGTKIGRPGPAPDGEEWFVMALFFAAHRWGNGEGIFNYEQEAQALLRQMLHGRPGAVPVPPMFDPAHKQIVFVPHGPGSRFTDPSYHLPAFYELWARWAADLADRAILAEVAVESRKLLRAAAHPATGLMPDYSEFDGRPHARDGHENFLFDAYRTIGNVALDWAWFGRDPWAIEQSNRVLAFLAAQGANLPNNYTLDGRPLTADYSPGLPAMAAVGALAADSADAKLFVQRLWDMPIPAGRERYYDGLLYFLALLQVGGRYHIHAPPAP
ncbi:MAG TPA: glycosyl hydrolase family 8 [Opitutaceae bacterium]|nr:glycosyl hydrolase family 8 [Opitutaceae bacterium]